MDDDDYSEADRVWFEENPGRVLRLRPTYPNEFIPCGTPVPRKGETMAQAVMAGAEYAAHSSEVKDLLGDTSFVLVYQFRPGMRIRIGVILPPDCPWQATPEFVLRDLFEQMKDERIIQIEKALVEMDKVGRKQRKGRRR